MALNTYTLLSGETLDLSKLDTLDKEYLEQLQRAGTDVDYFDLLRAVKGPEAPPRRGGPITPAVAESALYRVAHDIADRVGIVQGHVLAPDVDSSGLQPGSDLLSMTEAATLAEVSRPAIHQALKSGRLRGQQVGNAWIVRKADAEAYKRSRTTD